MKINSNGKSRLNGKSQMIIQKSLLMKTKSFFFLVPFFLFIVLDFSARAQLIVTQAAEGEAHTVYLLSDGSLWGLGQNLQGQLGLGNGSTYSVSSPQEIISNGVTAVVAGDYYTLFIKSDGNLWGMGGNPSGQLGQSYNSSQYYVPQQIVPGGVTAVAARGAHTLFIKSDGSLWGMGDDVAGDLGDGTNVSHAVPEQIVGGGVVAVAAGSSHSLFVKSDGSLWGMGNNNTGELGIGATNQSWVPVMIVASNVTSVAAGYEFSQFIKINGSLWGMGWDLVGQLGDGGNSTNAVYFPEQIVGAEVSFLAAGDYHALYLTQQGNLWAMGSDQQGQLGDGNAGFTIFNRFLPEMITNGVRTIFAGGSSSLYINNSGGLWGMGNNSAGQLGPQLGQKVIDPDPTPIAPFFPYNASPTNGQIPLLVNFTSANIDGFSSSIVSWNWNFGDGSRTNSQNASHLYSTPGIYSVSLSAVDHAGNVVIGTGPTTISAQPTNLVYSANPTNGFAPLTVSFSAPGSDANGNSITAWGWNFGDGNTSTLQNPSHTYLNPGNYQPSLVASNNLGELLVGTGSAIVSALLKPTLTYSASPTSGPPSLTVDFTSPQVDSAGNTITSWNWNFGDGIGTSTVQNPAYVYTTFGIYQPTLVVMNSLGESLNATGPAISAVLPFAFSACPTNGVFPATVSFTGPATDAEGNPIVKWSWDFGDSNGTSSVQSPRYVYFAPGHYLPTLTAENNLGDSFNVNGPAVNLTQGTFNSGLVVNGGFETGDFTGWYLTNSVTTPGTTVDQSQALDGSYGADFSQVGSLDYLSQNLTTKPNVAYVLSFWLNSPDGLTPSEFLASWNGTTLFDQTSLPAVGWTNLQFIVTSTTASAVLLFGGQNDNSDFGLDDVSVTPARPGLSALVASGSNLVLTGTNGINGQTYWVLAGTNLTTPLAQWTPVFTNALCMNGLFNFTLTNAVQSSIRQRFLVIELK